MSKDPKELPKGWKQVESKSRPGKVYFLHLKTGEKTWKLAHVHAKERELRHKAAALASAHKAGKQDGEKVHAYHILVKHAGSRRPSSWRQETITRSKDVAFAKMEGIRDKLIARQKERPEVGAGAGGTCVVLELTRATGVQALRELFEEIAKEESDCSSAKRGGDLGPFGRKQMTPPFEKAAFALKVGEMSGLVESDSGVHIILRVA
ncbi:hypothetical protein P43SY_000265 [Pythium insidiosum]|uniref:Peptidyl-prolyl cis-trans isomerase n=1 Tax=Pythium insidiosum TaxID=114742 RepID=A0AAD5LPP7_PYTIN|nr:hypothetical protein P43SY_000265 [Pythium insidiosum]KAJ0409565.1 hypothetical protein ATCC90586_010076 [Pythium insidiosum]